MGQIRCQSEIYTRTNEQTNSLNATKNLLTIPMPQIVSIYPVVCVCVCVRCLSFSLFWVSSHYVSRSVLNSANAARLRNEKQFSCFKYVLCVAVWRLQSVNGFPVNRLTNEGKKAPTTNVKKKRFQGVSLRQTKDLKEPAMRYQGLETFTVKRPHTNRRRREKNESVKR